MFDPVNRVLAWYKSYDLRALLRRDRGASAVEYALVLVFIAAAVVGVIAAIGSNVHAKFTSSCVAITGNPPSCP
jgi:Flp pilus assembly pilin Flp